MALIQFRIHPSVGAGTTDNTFEGGIRIEGELKAPAIATATTIDVGAASAVRLRAACGTDPADPATHFTVSLSQSVVPLLSPHELVQCTAIADTAS